MLRDAQPTLIYYIQFCLSRRCRLWVLRFQYGDYFPMLCPIPTYKYMECTTLLLLILGCVNNICLMNIKYLLLITVSKTQSICSIAGFLFSQGWIIFILVSGIFSGATNDYRCTWLTRQFREKGSMWSGLMLKGSIDPTTQIFSRLAIQQNPSKLMTE